MQQIYLHVNMCSEVDNSKQLVSFLEKMEKLKRLKNYKNVIVNLYYEEEKGHDGLGKDEAIIEIYKLLEL